MKKLKLTALNLGADQVLSRSQMKNVLGGDAATCSSSSTCGTTNSSGGFTLGSCTASTYTFSGVVYTECKCSATGYCSSPGGGNTSSRD